MKTLNAEDQATFKQLASAFLSTRERIELIREQAVDKYGEQPGFIPEDPKRIASVMDPGRALMNELINLMQKHPKLFAIRFRGHIFSLTIHKGQVFGLTMWREAEVEDVDG